MITEPAADHIVHIVCDMPLSAVIEAVAIFADGFVEGRTVSSMHFMFDMAAGEDAAAVITARLRHPTSQNPKYKILTPLYNLMAGFHKAGADVSVAGPLAGDLPSAGRLIHAARPAIAIRSIFEDHLPAVQRQPALDPAHLAEIFTALDGLKAFEQAARAESFRALFPAMEREPRDTATYYLTHRSGIDVVVLAKGGAVHAHCVEGRLPRSAGHIFNMSDVKPKPARTWGEAWIGHSWGGRRSVPEALEILPDEIAIGHDVEIYRYAIDDRATLANLSSVTFGPGKSHFLSAKVWVSMAEGFAENKDYATAIRCCEQAALRDEDPQANALAQEELARWREWLAFSSKQAGAPKRPPVEPSELKPFADLVAVLGPTFDEPLRQVAHELVRLRAEGHDYKRAPDPLPAQQSGGGDTLFQVRHPLVTGRRLIVAGVTPAALAHLGIHQDPIPPPERYPDLFTISCGGWTMWGTVGSDNVILREDPTLAYSLWG